MKLDILIKNGHVVDPASGVDEIRDIGIADGHIVSADTDGIEAGEIIDAKGYYVLPGLIDFHTHLYYGGSSFGVNPNLLFASGVTGAVDGGTAGCAGFEAFYRQTQLLSQLPLKFMLHISPIGQPGFGVQEPADPAAWNEEAVLNLVQKYSEEIVCLKLRIGRAMIGERGIAPLQEACRIARQAGLPLCVHVTDSPVSAREIAETLAPGDIYCHVYHGKGNTILDQDGEVIPAMREASRRGVIMDAANGSINFNYPVAKAAIEQGFLPDIISSDITPATLNRGCNAKNLPFIMSKYLALGMRFNDIVKTVTRNPAALMGLKDFAGTLAQGAPADLVILDKISGRFKFADADNREFYGNTMLSPLLTVSRGRIVFRQTWF